MYRSGFRNQKTSKMEFFMTVAYSLKSLVIVTKNFTSVVAEVLDRPTV